MSRNYIDFISAYCDNWCERCAFTERCSHFAVTSALAMCDGNFEAALELAIGRAQEPGRKAQKTLRERMGEAFSDYEEPSRQELNEIGREMDARDRRVQRNPLAQASLDYSVAGRRWFEEHHGCGDQADGPMREALEILQRDLFFIHVKIMRALDERDEDPSGAFWESAVQNDWNGSAKVALISIHRSEQAWRRFAEALRDEAATVLADNLVSLRDGMNKEFPRAMEFRRPGFDDPPLGAIGKPQP
jgi:hypothetical protein